MATMLSQKLVEAQEANDTVTRAFHKKGMIYQVGLAKQN